MCSAGRMVGCSLFDSKVSTTGGFVVSSVCSIGDCSVVGIVLFPFLCDDPCCELVSSF